MKKYILLPIILLIQSRVSTMAQTESFQQLQLDIEKLAQLKMMLNNMYSGYNQLANGYNSIKNQSLDNFNLHKDFLDGLKTISPTVKNDPAINVIVSSRALITSEYNTTYKQANGSGLFSREELYYFNKGYARICKQSDQNLVDLQILITPDKLQMSEGERINAIDKIRADMEIQLNAVKSFTKKVNTISAFRIQVKKDNQNLRNSYGIIK